MTMPYASIAAILKGPVRTTPFGVRPKKQGSVTERQQSERGSTRRPKNN
jgi:hypothetical protein